MICAKTFGEELATIVKSATTPILERMEALEKRFDDLPTPSDGKDADPQAVAEIVRTGMKAELDEIRAAVDAIEIPEPQELPDIPALIDEAVKAIPAPKDGERGEDGQSVTVDDVLPTLKEQVDAYLKSIPVPENGKDGADGKDGQDGEKGDPGLDGLDVKDLFRAEGGRLVAVMSDGQTKDLGVFVGKDGADGKDGAPGSDGRDGLGFEDLSFEEKDGRLYAVFKRGDIVKEACIPGLNYRGVWKSGEYLTGDSVTFGGSQWTALKSTEGKPGDSSDWQMSSKRGRDGRDAPKADSK